MDDSNSTLGRDIRSIFKTLARSSDAIEMLMGERLPTSPPHLLDQFMSLRNLSLAFRSDEDPMVFRAHTELRKFVNQAQGSVSNLHEIDENHAALLNQCSKLHAKYMLAIESGENGSMEFDEFESWAYALGDSIDQSILRFDAYLSSNFSMAKTLRQRSELNKEAVTQASNLSSWLAALSSAPLRQRLNEEAACRGLLQVFDEALFTRSKMARRLERCSDCIARLIEKLNTTQLASKRHALLAKASALDAIGFIPLPSDPLDLDETSLTLAWRLTPKKTAKTPATFNPIQLSHSNRFQQIALKSAQWAKDIETPIRISPANPAQAGSIHCQQAILPTKALQSAFEAFLDQIFEDGAPLSACQWLARRQLDDHDLGLSASSFLAWTCSQSAKFYEQKDVRVHLDRIPAQSIFSSAIIVDAVFTPELAEVV